MSFLSLPFTSLILHCYLYIASFSTFLNYQTWLKWVKSNFLILEKIEDDVPIREKVITPNLKINNGYIDVPSTAGLGVDIIEEEIKKLYLNQMSSVIELSSSFHLIKLTENNQEIFTAKEARNSLIDQKTQFLFVSLAIVVSSKIKFILSNSFSKIALLTKFCRAI